MTPGPGTLPGPLSARGICRESDATEFVHVCISFHDLAPEAERSLFFSTNWGWQSLCTREACSGHDMRYNLNFSEWVWTSCARIGLQLLDVSERVGARLRSMRTVLVDFGYRVKNGHWRWQEGLWEREQYLSRLLADSPEPMVVTDDKHRLLAANPAALTLFGISRRNLNKFTIDAFLRHDQVHCFEREGPPFIKRAERLGECQISPLNGRPRIVEFSFQANFLLGRHLSKFRQAPVGRPVSRHGVPGRPLPSCS
jgi:PAS domain-containing protein